jgi:FtsP/CotA-like multicopper oxidase with cupredoxin domain
MPVRVPRSPLWCKGGRLRSVWLGVDGAISLTQYLDKIEETLDSQLRIILNKVQVVERKEMNPPFFCTEEEAMNGKISLATLNTQFCVLLFALVPISVFAQSGPPVFVPPVPNSGARFPVGSVVQNPAALYSRNGSLTVDFSYQTRKDSDGLTLFSFMTPSGLENPTLHVRPGDHLIINLTNNTPATPVEMTVPSPNACGDIVMTGSSVNLHYHGTNTAPICGQDEVVHTIINSGQTFRYDVVFPFDEAPGLYWYHPHAHGLVEAALQGGASGAIIVEGIQAFEPEVAGLPHKILVIRDQNVVGNPTPGGAIPSWDLSVNFVPIAYPAEIPAIIQMRSGEKQLWRVVNASADTQLDLQLLYDGVPQPLKIVGLDGVPVDSQDGTRRGSSTNATDILIPTAGRAEFIVVAPSSDVKLAQFVTLNVNTGPDGDNDPQRVLATIQTVSTAEYALENQNDQSVPTQVESGWRQRFEGLVTAHVTARRRLYFSEDNPNSKFFITVDGATPTLFSPANPPAIVTTQGSIEDWTIQNRTLENHEFHMHQTHFLLLAQNNFEVNGSQPVGTIQGQFMDMVQIPYWDGNPQHPFPSVTIRMDFRGFDIGDFVYHCHIAEHEDAGMMAIIRVLPGLSTK